jgi:hypothetical protein
LAERTQRGRFLKDGQRLSYSPNLTWDMVLDANGQLSGLLELRDNAAKKGSGSSLHTTHFRKEWRQQKGPSSR